MIKHKLIYILLVTVYSGIIFLNGCEEHTISEHQPQQLPDIVLEEFSLTETQKGKKLWTLEAEMARVYETIINVDSVLIRFYDKDEVEFSILNAPGGLLNTKTHNILVGDSIVVRTNDSTILFTDSLFWQNDSQMILTNSYVKIVKHDGTVIEGKGLRADPYLKKIEIISETKGTSPIELPDINR